MYLHDTIQECIELNDIVTFALFQDELPVSHLQRKSEKTATLINMLCSAWLS